jgi:hypothetical protein
MKLPWGQDQTNYAAWVAFCISAVLHLCISLILALIFIASQGNGTDSLVFSLAVQQESSEVELSSLEAAVEMPAEAPETAEPSVDLSSNSLNVDADSSITPAFKSYPQVTAASAEIGRSLASSRGGAIASMEEDKSPSKASFFGVQAEGNRFVFVIDSSGSMRGARWTALVYELIRCIRGLSPDQDFFVLSFDTNAHPMFGIPPPAGKFLHPTPRNVTKLHNWLKAIELGHNTLPAEAMGVAIQLKPDAIFLLSDGEIRDSTVQQLRLWNVTKDEKGYPKTQIPIHTILLHSTIGFATLETIANENGGTFTPVPMR